MWLPSADLSVSSASESMVMEGEIIDPCAIFHVKAKIVAVYSASKACCVEAPTNSQLPQMFKTFPPVKPQKKSVELSSMNMTIAQVPFLLPSRIAEEPSLEM